MMSNEVKIGVILLNFNGTKDSITCIKSLQLNKLSNLKLHIIVVDNGSTTGQLEDLRRFIKRIKSSEKSGDLTYDLITNESNLGFTGGNNIGIKKALADNCSHILLLNNDTFVASNFIEQLWKFFETKKDGIFGPKIYFAAGSEYHFTRYNQNQRGKVIWYAGGLIDWQNLLFSHRGIDKVDNGQFDRPGLTEFVSGCAMFLSRKVIVDIGLLDERYFTYLEDVDFSLRAKNAGYALWYVPTAKIWHKNASSSGKPGSPIHIYYQTRNRLIFSSKYASLKTKFALFRESLKDIVGDNQRRQAVWDFYLGKTGK